jgi:nicotinate-nucleotide pyrophosphorylase (carboxylating)
MNAFNPPSDELIHRDVQRALEEDVGSGDVTAALLPDQADSAYLLCKETGVIAGRPWFDACLQALDPQVRIHWRIHEGDKVNAMTVIATIEGRSRSLVTGERSALNFLQTLSATATKTREFVDALSGTKTRVLDTRKTIPGLRQAQKYAVRVGGGVNHRMGLFDAIMLKENHIHAAGSITAAANHARKKFPQHPLIIEVENLDQLREALSTNCLRILIDDFNLDDMRAAVAIADGKIPLECSGSVDLPRLREIAATGVDFVSVGALTKHIRALDLSMKLGEPKI